MELATTLVKGCDRADTLGDLRPTPLIEIEVGLLTGGSDKPYAFGLAMALISEGVTLDVIGSDEIDSPEMHTFPALRFLNLRGNQRPDAGLGRKISRVLVYYARLIRYVALARPKILHILWNNKFLYFDRTLLMLYYRMAGKKIVFTAHNVNAAKRDGSDSILNRLSLRVQYQLAGHIFVHTEQMKRELQNDFRVDEGAITVIPFGINNSVPHTDLTAAQAKQRLGITNTEKAILFFGRIGPYKGLDILVAAFQRIARTNPTYRLIIVGQPKKGAETYWADINQVLNLGPGCGQVIQKIEFIPDEDTELYFKAGDVLVLPYTQIFQSGVLFLGYSFGLPVIAADVGSFREDIVEGRTGFLCRSCDPMDLANTIEMYFESDLFKNLSRRRREIQSYAYARHSWDVVGEMTRSVYAGLLKEQSF